MTSKPESAAVLAAWLAASRSPTIGDIGTFGRAPWLRIELSGIEIVLNPDTKRAAVEKFVRASTSDPNRQWLVVATQRGNATKVLPGPTDEPAPGWYAYLIRPGTVGQLI